MKVTRRDIAVIVASTLVIENCWIRYLDDRAKQKTMTNKKLGNGERVIIIRRISKRISEI